MSLIIQVPLDKETYPNTKGVGRGLFATREIKTGQKMYDIWRKGGKKPDVIVVNSFNKVPKNKKGWAFEYVSPDCVYPRSSKFLGFAMLINHSQDGANVRTEFLIDECDIEKYGRIVLLITVVKDIHPGDEILCQCFKGRFNGKRYPDPKVEGKQPPSGCGAKKNKQVAAANKPPPSGCGAENNNQVAAAKKTPPSGCDAENNNQVPAAKKKPPSGCDVENTNQVAAAKKSLPTGYETTTNWAYERYHRRPSPYFNRPRTGFGKRPGRFYTGILLCGLVTHPTTCARQTRTEIRDQERVVQLRHHFERVFTISDNPTNPDPEFHIDGRVGERVALKVSKLVKQHVSRPCRLRF